MSEYRPPKTKPENVRPDRSNRKTARMNANKNRHVLNEDERALIAKATEKLNEVYGH